MSTDADSLSALLGARAERQHREMMLASIAAGVIGQSAQTIPKALPAGITTPEDYMRTISRGAWIIATLAIQELDALKASGKL